MPSRRIATVLAITVLAAACSEDGGDSSGATSAPSNSTAATSRETAPPATEPESDLPLAGWMVQPGTEQVAVLGAEPGTELRVIARDAAGADATASGVVDEQGALLFRSLPPGEYRLESDTERTEPFAIASPDDVPPAELYSDEQTLLPQDSGFGYITTRDGTTLSANVILPGPAADGPYPTVVEYSGYSPSNPDDAALAMLYTLQGFAYVGVNMRGTGCSGGSYRFFETAQSLDGYDVVEAVAAQPWVLNHKVGLVGISYPGISQLFVAATQPPSLAAITPLSVIDDSYRSTLYPGGILNTGFAVEWTSARQREAAPYGQGWTKERADGGDDVCAANQALRLQNPDLVGEIDDTPYYTDVLGDSLAPITFVDRIEVPVMLAGAWQDEQTGGHFPVMLPEFTSSPHVYVDLVNGLHTESLSPRILARTMEFLQLYVAERTPDIGFANAAAPVLGQAIWGVGTFAPFQNRFEGMAFEDALAAFEAEPPVRVHFEQGGNDDYAAGTPEPGFTAEFSAWPIPEAEAAIWNLDGNGALTNGTPVNPGQSMYTAEPAALPATFYEGDGNAVWRADVRYDWQPLPSGTGVGFATAPLDQDLVVAGSGSVDLWVQATAEDTDLEVTITEIRPDGTEIYVQSGWLRASHRTLDEAASSEIQPVHTHLEADAAALPAGAFTAVRVELFSFAHVFRAGSRIRLTVDAPGNSRAIWQFPTTISAGETVTIAHDADHLSRVVLSVLPGVDVPTPAPPACGALRGQPCRAYEPAANGG